MRSAAVEMPALTKPRARKRVSAAKKNEKMTTAIGTTSAISDHLLTRVWNKNEPNPTEAVRMARAQAAVSNPMVRERAFSHYLAISFRRRRLQGDAGHGRCQGFEDCAAF